MGWSKEKQKAYMHLWNIANREKENKRKLAWAHLPENLERIRESAKRRYVRDIEQRKIYRKAQYHRDRKKSIKRTMDWRKEHPEKVRLYTKLNQHKRRCLGKISVKLLQSIYEENIKTYKRLTCELCFKPIMFGEDSIEHKTPVCRGGTNEKDNLCIAHLSCNAKKNRKTLEEYRNVNLS